jgi:hypothetical protein
MTGVLLRCANHDTGPNGGQAPAKVRSIVKAPRESPCERHIALIDAALSNGHCVTGKKLHSGYGLRLSGIFQPAKIFSKPPRIEANSFAFAIRPRPVARASGDILFMP